MASKWLSTGQAAELLGVHRTTVLRYIDEGRLPARRLPTGAYRIDREQVERLLQEPGEKQGG